MQLQAGLAAAQESKHHSQHCSHSWTLLYGALGAKVSQLPPATAWLGQLTCMQAAGQCTASAASRRPAMPHTCDRAYGNSKWLPLWELQ